jgi:DNA polymerase-3 subunit gamma/tau
MSLYLRYRPKTLDKVVGNQKVVAAIDSLLNKGKDCPHVFLLTGPTGCGKTTIGRIIADRLGCKGSDFKEVDSADFRGIDTVRDIRTKMHFKAGEGSCRVYLIDEVHKMTNDAQNAFLKGLEDTPPHVYFILCTTEPQKLLATIKGRCSTFQLNLLTEAEMHSVLSRVVKLCKETLDEKVYEAIIDNAAGHPRNALQILEQVLSMPAKDRLDVAKRKQEELAEVKNLCQALLKRAGWKELSYILRGIKDQEPESVRRAVLGYASAVLLNKDDTICGLILEEFINPFYDSGFPQLVYATYSVYNNSK